MVKKRRLPKGFRNTNIGNALADMKYIDLQRACIIRGIDFEDLVEGDSNRLQSWLSKNWLAKKSPSRLDEFDNWRYKTMKALGKEDEPFIRLGFIGKVDEDGNPIAFKRPPKIRKEKAPKREKTDQGLFKGTKKAFTFECSKNGISLPETIILVCGKFPDAQEKSIRIWWKKAKRT